MAQIVRIDIQANLQWKAWQDPASKAWIGECQALGLIAEGETWSDLQEMIADITNAHPLPVARTLQRMAGTVPGS